MHFTPVAEWPHFLTVDLKSFISSPNNDGASTLAAGNSYGRDDRWSSENGILTNQCYWNNSGHRSTSEKGYFIAWPCNIPVKWPDTRRRNVTPSTYKRLQNKIATERFGAAPMTVDDRTAECFPETPFWCYSCPPHPLQIASRMIQPYCLCLLNLQK